MKFKKSYLVLIAIAIFLLISIGSVCASENVTDDSDDALADDGTDVVLSDTDENVPDDTNKINTTVETEKDTYEFKQDSNKTIPVEIKDNKSSKIDVNKSDLFISDGNKSIAFEYNSSVVTITESLPYGYYNLTIGYLGNENYINSSKVVSVKIYGNNTIETQTSVVCDGVNIEIPVKIKDQVDYIQLIESNFNLTLIYTNETGNVSNLTISSFTVEDGKIKFTSPVKLINASVMVNYVNATEPKMVGIKVSTEVKAEKDEYKFKSEEIKNISIEILDGQGNLLNINKTDLKVFDNGNEITNFEYNNTNLTLALDVGVHNITVAYVGDETYNASESTITVKVSGNYTINAPDYVVTDNLAVEIPVTLFDGADTVNGTKDGFTLNLTYKNETGDVVSKIIDNFNYNDGVISFVIEQSNSNSASVTMNYTNSTGAKTVKINLATSVTAVSDKNKYRYNETNNITVTVLDNTGNPLTVNKNDLKVFDNGVELAANKFTYNNSIMTVSLGEGVHNLTIAYKGNDTFNSSSTTIELKVFGDLKIDANKTVVLDDSNKATITLNLNDGADLIEIDINKLNVTLFYTVGNQTSNKPVAPTVSGQNIAFEITDDFDSAYALIKYSENNLTNKTTIKVNTEIGASDLQFGDVEVKNFTIEVKGTNGHIINLTNDNIKVFKDGKAVNIEVNNSVITIKDAYKFGVYNLTIKYIGTDTYIESVKNITLTVLGFNATTSTNVNSTKTGNVKVELMNGTEVVNITVDNLTAKVTYTSGNDTIEIPVTLDKIENGTLTFTLAEGNFTKAVLNIKYNNASEVNITLNRIYNVNITVVNAVNEYQNGVFTFKLVDIDDPNTIVPKGTSFTLTTVGNIRAGHTSSTDENGTITYKNINLYEYSQQTSGVLDLTTRKLEVGNHEVELSTSGSNIKSKTIKVNLTITQAHINIVINKFEEYYGVEKNLTVTVTNAHNGEAVPGTILKLNIPQISTNDYYLSTDSNGIARILVKGIVGGTYSMTVSNNDTKNIANAQTTGSMTIKKLPVVIDFKDITISYNSGDVVTVKVLKDGAPLSEAYVHLKLYTSSTKYEELVYKTNDKGEISFTASLSLGAHKLVLSMADNRYDGGEITKTITVKKAKGTFTAKKTTAYYKGGKYFTIKLTNSKTKKPIYNVKVNIKVYISKNRYYNYNGNTGSNGQLKLLLNGYKPGTYKVVITCADSKKYGAEEITTKIVIKKTPTKLVAKKLTAKKGAKKYFTVTAKNKKTKKPISGLKLKVKVFTGKKSKTYTIKTKSKGIAKLSVKKLAVGNHKVIVKSANKYCVAKQKKSVIKIKK